jgi:hypothetical protein
LLGPVEHASSFREAEKLIKPLVPYFDRFSKDQAATLARMAVGNGQIWSAKLCFEEYLPQFLKLNKTKIRRSLYTALKYQVENQAWYEHKQK